MHVFLHLYAYLNKLRKKIPTYLSIIFVDMLPETQHLFCLASALPVDIYHVFHCPLLM